MALTTTCRSSRQGRQFLSMMNTTQARCPVAHYMVFKAHVRDIQLKLQIEKIIAMRVNIIKTFEDYKVQNIATTQ